MVSNTQEWDENFSINLMTQGCFPAAPGFSPYAAMTTQPQHQWVDAEIPDEW